ncbi:hypothetical protein OAL10_05020 [Gammaproteobacteria bacterium]|nr:hypothetical protein [Gammaproteobacteria bacterium]
MAVSAGDIARLEGIPHLPAKAASLVIHLQRNLPAVPGESTLIGATTAMPLMSAPIDPGFGNFTGKVS